VPFKSFDRSGGLVHQLVGQAGQRTGGGQLFSDRRHIRVGRVAARPAPAVQGPPTSVQPGVGPRAVDVCQATKLSSHRLQRTGRAQNQQLPIDGPTRYDSLCRFEIRLGIRPFRRLEPKVLPLWRVGAKASAEFPPARRTDRERWRSLVLGPGSLLDRKDRVHHPVQPVPNALVDLIADAVRCPSVRSTIAGAILKR
jgi:hypothetical protein